jgi:uncharacterized protein YidB (DUF937 family)
MVDQILKNVLGNVNLSGPQAQQLVGMIMQKVQDAGGLQALVGQLGASGLGEKAASWVGSGENAPISAEEARASLGDDFIQDAANKLNLDPQTVSAATAQALPDVVNAATPDGQIPDAANPFEAIQGMLGGGQGLDLGQIGGMLGGLLGNQNQS